MTRTLLKCCSTIAAVIGTMMMVACWPKIPQEPYRNGGTLGSGQYYVIGRYKCVDASDGSSAGSCDITNRDNSSCQAAYQAQSQYVSSLTDVCVQCNGTDNTKRYSGSMSWIQDGPCRVSSSLTPNAFPGGTDSPELADSLTRRETSQIDLDTRLLASEDNVLGSDFRDAFLPDAHAFP